MIPANQQSKSPSACTQPADPNLPGLIALAREHFFKLDPNIIGIRVAPGRGKTSLPGSEPVLVVQVMQKLLLSDLDPQRVVPREFRGLRTDVRAPLSADGADSNEDDMRAISWARVHVLSLSEDFLGRTRIVRDYGDVCVIQVDDTVVKTHPDGTRYVDYVAAYKLFRTLHGDHYDFVTFIPDSENGMPGVLQSYQAPVFNDVQGIGFWPVNDRPAWNTTRLQGFHVLRQSVLEEARPNTLLQEFGHQFGAFARYRDPATGETKSDHLLDGIPGHWADHLDDDQSPMDYDRNDWLERPNGTFRRVFLDPTQNVDRPYCNLDLYLMGLLHPDCVGEFTMLRDVAGLPASSDFSATPVRLNIKDFIAQEGPRVPAFADAPKQWRQAFIVLTLDIHKVHDLADKTDAARYRWEQEFRNATKGRGQVDTLLRGSPGGTVTFTVVIAVRQGFGTDGQSLRAMEPDVPLVGTSKDYTFACPDLNPSEPAVLMFQSRAVNSRRNVFSINEIPVFGGIPVSPGVDAWNANVMLINPDVLRPSGNVLHVESRSQGGGSGGDLDDFIIDNLVVMYKVRRD
ncbi:MAG: hypothetical protein JNK85_18075 [Verrucomicrobiales bacterium]|nr:hypothetical protein [Verrucomicrobiales bacterium]